MAVAVGEVVDDRVGRAVAEVDARGDCVVVIDELAVGLSVDISESEAGAVDVGVAVEELLLVEVIEEKALVVAELLLDELADEVIVAVREAVLVDVAVALLLLVREAVLVDVAVALLVLVREAVLVDVAVALLLLVGVTTEVVEGRVDVDAAGLIVVFAL